MIARTRPVEIGLERRILQDLSHFLAQIRERAGFGTSVRFDSIRGVAGQLGMGLAGFG
jgi:hypothetical protein